ncbi:MAG: amidase, partial [Gammaproteobacteria bacterium]
TVMGDSNWLERGVQGIARGISDGTVRAADVLAAQLAQTDAREPLCGAYITQTRARADAAAARVDAAVAAGVSVGPLAGVPIAVKDIFDIDGLPTTAGMPVLKDNVATGNATVIDRLDDAGALITGKLTLTEGVYAEHRLPFPAPRNPWHAEYWSGASSSGTGVAVAGGLCVAALGSETGGSIKLPAAVNGVTALKPSWGRVSRHGVFELAATLDHVGPFGRSVADVASLLQVIAGPDPADPTAAQIAVPDYLAAMDAGLEGMRIGIDPAWIADGVDPQTRAALDDAVSVLRDAGGTVKNVAVPDVSAMIWDWFPICAVQTALAHRETFPSRRNEYGPALVQLLDMGLELTGLQYQALILKRERFRGELAALFTRVDALAIPVLAFPVPTLERMASIDNDLIAGLHRFTCPFNLSGSPGLVLPCGVNSERMPIVFQLVGRHFEEERLIAAGAAFQAATDWHLRRPDFGGTGAVA